MVLLCCSLVALVAGVLALLAWTGIARPLPAFTAFWVLVLAHLAGETLLVGALLRLLHPVALLVTAVVVAGLEVGLAVRSPGALRRLAEMARAAAGTVWRRAWRHPVVALFSLAVLAEYGWLAVQAVGLPQVAWDGLSYYLISPATWIQHGAIVHTTQTVFSDTHPQDQELVTAWVGTSVHSLRYAGLTPLPFAAAGFGAVAMLARGLGARRHLAVLAGAGFLAVPALLLQADTAYVDLAAAASALAALAFVLASTADNVTSPRGLLVYLGVAGGAAGLAAGTRSTNLVVVVSVVALAVVQNGRAFGSSVLRPALVAGIPSFALGAFWCIRNLVTYGNPFYPFSIFGFRGLGSVDQLLIGANKPASLDDVPAGVLGAIVKSWATDLHRHAYVYDQRLGGFGLQWLLVAFPALVVLVVLLVVSRRHWLYLAGLVLPVVVLWLASGAPWWARYSLPLAGLGCVAVAVCLQRLGELVKGATGTRRVGLAVADALVPVAYAGTAVLTMWWATSPSQVDLAAGRHAYRPSTPGQIAHLIGQKTPTGVFPWNQFTSLDHVVPAGATIALTADDSQPFTYPFVGPDLSHRLVRVGSPSTAAQLARMLRADHAGYAALDFSGPTAALLQSVDADPDQFRALTSGGAVGGSDIYQLGHWHGCRPVPIRIQKRAGNRGSLILVASLRDGCGPVRGATVTLWRASPGQPAWAPGSRLLAKGSTGARGEVTFGVPERDVAAGSDLWTHFGGRYQASDYRPSSASALLRVGRGRPHRRAH